jgi:hypothetical protein
MKNKKFEVKSASTGESWEFSYERYPENYEEAEEVLGREGAWDVFESGLDVRIQNLGREAFRKGKTQEEVEEIVNGYQPGGGRSSKKQRALGLVFERATDINSDPELKDGVQTAFRNSDWDTIINLLGEE